jgi:hypothetical protein
MMPDAATWRRKAVALRVAATRHEVTRDALVTLADDCEEIAEQMERQAEPGGATIRRS